MPLRNWSKNISLDASSVECPQNSAELSAVLHRANSHSSTVRAIGSLHSYSPLVSGADCLIDASAFNEIQLVDNNCVRVGAGVTIDALIESLRTQNLMLPIMGEITEQTIAGATATCTHGGSHTWGVLSDLIVAVELVDGRGQWLRLQKGDAHFSAACMSLGLLGVIVAIELRVIPLMCYRLNKSIQTVKEWRHDWLEQSSQHAYFQLDWFSHTDVAVVKAVDACDSCACRSQPDEAEIQQFLLELYNCHSLAYSNNEVAITTQRVLASALQPQEFFHDLDKLLTVTHKQRMVTSEFFVRCEQVAEAIELVLEERWSQPALLTLRQVQQDSVLLSPAYQQNCVAIACVVFSDQNFDPPVLKQFNRLMRGLDARPHWAKLCGFDQLDTAQLFPGLLPFLDVRKKFDPNGVFYSQDMRCLLNQQH